MQDASKSGDRNTKECFHWVTLTWAHRCSSNWHWSSEHCCIGGVSNQIDQPFHFNIYLIGVFCPFHLGIVTYVYSMLTQDYPFLSLRDWVFIFENSESRGSQRWFIKAQGKGPQAFCFLCPSLHAFTKKDVTLSSMEPARISSFIHQQVFVFPSTLPHLHVQSHIQCRPFHFS